MRQVLGTSDETGDIVSLLDVGGAFLKFLWHCWGILQ